MTLAPIADLETAPSPSPIASAADTSLDSTDDAPTSSTASTPGRSPVPADTSSPEAIERRISAFLKERSAHQSRMAATTTVKAAAAPPLIRARSDQGLLRARETMRLDALWAATTVQRHRSYAAEPAPPPYVAAAAAEPVRRRAGAPLPSAAEMFKRLSIRAETIELELTAGSKDTRAFVSRAP